MWSRYISRDWALQGLERQAIRRSPLLFRDGAAVVVEAGFIEEVVVAAGVAGADVHRKLVITNRFIELMEEHGVSRSELAKRMGVQPSGVTAMLSGTSNLTIDILVRAGLALGAELHQTFVPTGCQVKWVIENPVSESGLSLTSRVAEDPAPYPVTKSNPTRTL